MKSSKLALKLCAIIAALVAFPLSTQAQNRERFGISAKAGGVNAVSGQVMVKRGAEAAQLLTSQDDLSSGDVVTTGRDSQAEILLNPGTYLRLSEKSQFVMVDNSLDNLLVRMNKGSAIIEATGPDNVELHIPIVTDQQRMTIARAGIYRVNVSAGVTELLVRKGRVWLGDDPKNLVKSGKKVSFIGSTPLTAKLTKQDRDEFDDWSRARGQTLARANERLSTRVLSGYLSSGSWSFSASYGRSYGLWTWSPFSSCYTFLPFYYGWSSPYGRYYGLYTGYGPYYPRTYGAPVIVSNPSSGSNGSTGSSFPGSSGSSNGGFGSTTPGRSVGAPSGPSAGSQAGPRDPDSGSRSINRIKDPN